MTAKDVGAGVAAAVDVGSNSVHVLVGIVAAQRIAPLADESVFLGLGARIDAAGHLGAPAREELTAVLVRYAEAARDLHATSITFVGTEPLRRAADGQRIVADVERASGISLHVLSHEEEAYLTLIGVSGGRRIAAEMAVIDVGGGSTEVVSIGPDHPVSAIGLRVGSARLTASIVEHDPPTPAEIVALRAAAWTFMETAPDISPRELVAVGGTASNLLRILPAATLDGTLDRRRLGQALRVLSTEPSAVASERHGVNPVRARILPAGAAILEAILRRYRAPTIRVAEEGIREGTLLAVTHQPIGWRDRLGELVFGWDDD